MSYLTYIKLFQGSPLDLQDCNGNSPLLLAATRLSSNAVCTLIDAGCDLTIKDHDNRNYLHLAVRNGGRLCDFGETSKPDVSLAHKFFHFCFFLPV